MRPALQLPAILVALPILYLLAGLAGALLPNGADADDGPLTARIGLLRGPIHYDILLPLTPDLRARFAFAAADGVPVDTPAAEWLVAGWGAQGFYTTVGSYADVTAPVLWRGVTGDDPVMHLEVAGTIGDVPGLTWVPVSTGQMDALTRAVEAGFLRDANGLAVPLPGLNHGATDAFYAGAGRFHIGQTCNVWVGQVLRAAGIPFGRWTPTPQAVQLSLWWFSPGATGG